MLTIQTKHGPRNVATVWKGSTLSVHRPHTVDGPSKAPRRWTLTHNASGLSISTVNVAKADAVALARLWDIAAAAIDPANPKAWPHLQSFRDDLGRLGSLPLRGPVVLSPMEALERATTPAEITAAVWQAMGYNAATETEAAEQWPAADTVPADLLRSGAAGLEILWRGRWWPVPTLGDVELWCLDSVAETPDGRTVESDHPEAWPAVLGVI